MSEVKCNDCGTEAVTKLSKAQKVYYSCPTCPSDNPAFKGKFLTMHDKLDTYNKLPKKPSPRQDCNPCDKLKEVAEKVVKKRKAEKAPEDQESEKLKLLSEEIQIQSKRISEQISKTDLLLERIERLLDSSKPQSEDETDDTTE